MLHTITKFRFKSTRVTLVIFQFLCARYLNFSTRNHAAKSQAAPVVGALFGLGRAGSIHLTSIVNNPRIVLKYVVDDRKEIFPDLRKYWKFGDNVHLITSAESKRVYEDKRYVLVWLCIRK